MIHKIEEKHLSVNDEKPGEKPEMSPSNKEASVKNKEKEAQTPISFLRDITTLLASLGGANFLTAYGPPGGINIQLHKDASIAQVIAYTVAALCWLLGSITAKRCETATN